MANFVDGLIHGLIFVPARVLCGGSRTHMTTTGGLCQAAPFTRCDRRCGGFKDDRRKRHIYLITCDGCVYTCILFRAVCLAYIKNFDV